MRGPNLARPLAHRVGRHPVDANGRERQRGERERGHEQRQRPRPRNGAADDLPERLDVNGHLALPPVHDRRHRGRERRRILGGAHEERDAAVGTLGCRDEDRLPNRPVQRGPRVADHAHNRPLDVVTSVGMIDVDPQPAANRLSIGELLLDELLA